MLGIGPSRVDVDRGVVVDHADGGVISDAVDSANGELRQTGVGDAAAGCIGGKDCGALRHRAGGTVTGLPVGST